MPEPQGSGILFEPAVKPEQAQFESPVEPHRRPIPATQDNFDPESLYQA